MVYIPGSWPSYTSGIVLSQSGNLPTVQMRMPNRSGSPSELSHSSPRSTGRCLMIPFQLIYEKVLFPHYCKNKANTHTHPRCDTPLELFSLVKKQQLGQWLLTLWLSWCGCLGLSTWAKPVVNQHAYIGVSSLWKCMKINKLFKLFWGPSPVMVSF